MLYLSIWTAMPSPMSNWFHHFFLGQISGSPKPSSFPNLPDISPKKVSSSHNVYVSPLRQTKVFSLSVLRHFIWLFAPHLVLSIPNDISIAYTCLKFYNTVTTTTTTKPFLVTSELGRPEMKPIKSHNSECVMQMITTILVGHSLHQLHAIKWWGQFLRCR